MNDKKIIVISGPSGVGKTTLYKKILRKYSDQISFSISATTRKKRENEEEGKDYYFMSDDQFRQSICLDKFLEWAQVYGHYYGTLKSEIERIWSSEKHCLLDLDVQGGLGIQKKFGSDAFLIFIAPPSIEELELRLRKRGCHDELTLKNRLNNAQNEMDKRVLYDLVLQNENLEKTTVDLFSVVDNIVKNSCRKTID